MNKRQKKIQEIFSKFKKGGEEIYYYGRVNFKWNTEKFIEQLDNISDRITLAQLANDFKLASKLISEGITDEEQIKLYQQLKETNIDIDETLNIELLTERYSFLGDLLDVIVTDLEIQQRLISLSDEKLQIFKQLFEIIKRDSSNPISIITKVLRALGESLRYDINTYSALNTDLEEQLKQGAKLDEKDLEKLLYLYVSANTELIWEWEVKSLNDLRNFGDKNSSDVLKINKMVDDERNLPIKNIDNIKSALLFRSYGISLATAKKILTKYNAEKIEITDENRKTMQLYLSLKEIVTEKDAGKLIKIYDELSEQKDISFDYMNLVLIENELRDLFLREYNKVAFKPEGQESEVVDGIKVYNAGTDFKIIMTSVGAYQGKKTIDNYCDYWNSPHIRSHGNCCSLIANNNLATAQIYNVCFGFTDFEPGMLLRAGNRDLNSTVFSKELDFTWLYGDFMVPDELIDSTRDNYNELVYERRDLSRTREKYKKNPSYIVFIEEFEGENIENLTDEDIANEEDEEKRTILQEQKRIWEESKKAAKDFCIVNEDGKETPLPIVKINREECAKSELSKIEEAFNTYLEIKDPNLLSQIIIQHENNRAGNGILHPYIRKKYFSRVAMIARMRKITEIIESIEDDNLRRENIDKMHEIILSDYRNRYKEGAGFYHETFLNIYEQMQQEESKTQ